MIETSALEVNTGSRLVVEASVKLEAVPGEREGQFRLIEGIARDSREQALAIEEISVAVRQIDEMTQHNAALVEQTNAAIEQTEGQAGEIENVIAGFRTSSASIVQASASVSRPRRAGRRAAHLSRLSIQPYAS